MDTKGGNSLCSWRGQKGHFFFLFWSLHRWTFYFLVLFQSPRLGQSFCKALADLPTFSFLESLLKASCLDFLFFPWLEKVVQEERQSVIETEQLVVRSFT